MRLLPVLAVVTCVLLAPVRADACDLCSPPPPEFSTIQAELEAAPTVVLADRAGDDMMGRPHFVIRDVLRGGDTLIAGQGVGIEDSVSSDGVFLLFGSPPSFDARRPRRIEEDVAAFATLLARAPTKVEENPTAWGKWLSLMVPYLSDRDPLIAASAGQEFAEAPYAAVKAVKGRVKPDLLLHSLEDRATAVRSRGALALLVGICATTEQVPRVEALLANERYRAAPGYDAIVAAYLMLRGRDGLPRVREIVRERLAARDARTGVSVLAALRFHAQRESVLPRAAILDELRALLDEDALAPAVILELATLEDWASLPHVMDAYRRLRPKSPMVLGPAARFVQECPLPEAEAARAEVTGKKPEIDTGTDEGE